MSCHIANICNVLLSLHCVSCPICFSPLPVVSESAFLCIYRADICAAFHILSASLLARAALIANNYFLTFVLGCGAVGGSPHSLLNYTFTSFGTITQIFLVEHAIINETILKNPISPKLKKCFQVQDRQQFTISLPRSESQNNIYIKPKLIRKIVIIVGVFAALLLVGWVITLLINGNNKTTEGPTRDRMPPYIEQVSPADGEEVTEWQGYCVLFLFRVGNGMGKNPESKITAYLDGEDITASLTGIITLVSPPSSGNYCYNSSVKISPGWHTAKVIYSDNKNNKFSYTWRILVDSEQKE